MFVIFTDQPCEAHNYFIFMLILNFFHQIYNIRVDLIYIPAVKLILYSILLQFNRIFAM